MIVSELKPFPEILGYLEGENRIFIVGCKGCAEVCHTGDEPQVLEMKEKLEEIARIEEIIVGGETTIEDEVLAAIAGVAAKEVEGVSSLGTSSIRRILAERLGGAQQRARGVEVESGRKEAIVDLTLNIIYGFSIPTIVIGVRKKVAARLLEIAGLIAKEINVSVVGIEFPERMPGRLE